MLDELAVPLLAAPMAGGPSTPDLVLAAASAGGVGFVAGGYLGADALAAQLAIVRRGSARYGVNLFAPNPVPVEPSRYRAYRTSLLADAERFGSRLPVDPLEDDDHWRDKTDLLIESPAPIVSFTFALPPPAALAALRRTGSVLVQTVTSVAEAMAAVEAGMDGLVVQSSAAGGHSGAWHPDRPPDTAALPVLVRAVRARTSLPVIAAGGIGDAAAVRDVLAAGAVAAMAGTAFLLAPEAGTNETHRAALSRDWDDTVVTRAFTGRPARALRNAFVAAHDADAPSGYPALHHLTSPLRRAAAAAGDPEGMHLWAGTNYRRAVARPLAATFEALTSSADRTVESG